MPVIGVGTGSTVQEATTYSNSLGMLGGGGPSGKVRQHSGNFKTAKILI